MHSHRRKNFLLTATILAVVAAVADQSQAQQNNPNMSPGLGGSPSARPDSSMFNQGPGVPSAFPGLDTFSKGDARGKQGGSFEDKIIKEQQRLQTKKQDGLEKTKSSSKGTTEGSPQPDPPSRVPGSAAVQPELKAGVPGSSVLVPSGLGDRLEDKAFARDIEEIEKLLESGVGLPKRQAGRTNKTSPQFDSSGLPGKIPESNTKGSDPKAPPDAKDAEDMLAGRGIGGGERDDKYDIGQGAPGAAGAKVTDPRGQASDGDVYSETTTNSRGEKETTSRYRNADGTLVVVSVTQRRDGSTVKSVETSSGYSYDGSGTREITLTRADGSWVSRTETYDIVGETYLIDYRNSRSGGEVYSRWVPLDDQPAPTDDYRGTGNDNCLWVPGIGCTARRVSPMDMTGQPGRGEGGGPAASALPNASHATNPDERGGPVGFRAPPNPGGPSSPDPSRGGTNPPPR